MTVANHLLHITIGAEGYNTYRLECLPGSEHFSYVERFWDDPNECHCTAADCGCREGDHYACEEFGAYIEDMGAECRQDRDASVCWVHDWFNEYGSECLHGSGWVEDLAPHPVVCWYNNGLIVDPGVLLGDVQRTTP